MSKAKLFLENFIVYGIGGVIGKAIPLIMIPIITRILPDSTYFGINDNTTSLVSITSYIALMGMYDAMYRMYFDKKDIVYQKQVCSTVFMYTYSASAIVCVLMILLRNQLAVLFYGDNELAYVIIIAAATTLVSATNTIVAGPARMRNKKLIYVLMNSLIPLMSYTFALFFISRGHFIIALPLATLISGLINEVVFLIYNREWFSIKHIDFSLLKPLLKFAIPLIPNFLIYWVFNSCDRLMITQMLGIGAAGLYGIASKLGTASQLIYTAFAGGWQYFVYSTMRDKNQVKDNSKLFEYMGLVSMICTMFLCAVSYFIFTILFPEIYWEGYVVAPYLFLAPLCQMLFQIAVSQFAIIKKTWPNMLFLSTGAIVNYFLNLTLIPVIGIEGAAIATLTGYIVSVFICVLTLSKLNLLVIRKKFLLCIVLFLIFFILWRYFESKNMGIGLLMAAIVTVVIAFIYKDDLSKQNLLKLKNGKRLLNNGD